MQGSIHDPRTRAPGCAFPLYLLCARVGINTFLCAGINTFLCARGFVDHGAQLRMIEDPLFPYQLQGADWLATKRFALLADEMGVGKTAQVIRAADNIKAERILVLCPAIARINWQREFSRFSTQQRSSYVVMDSKPSAKHSKLIICSYDLAANFHKNNTDWLSSDSLDLLVLDEAHYLKGVETLRTKAVYGRTGLIRRAKKCWALTGTPMPNHPGELWPILYTFGATTLSYDAFVSRYCNGYEGPRGFKITGARSQHIPELRQVLGKVMLRRKKVDVMKELPPIHFDHVTVPPGPVDLDVHFVQYVFPRDERQLLTEKLEKETRLVTEGLRSTTLGRDGLTLLQALSESVSTLRRYTGLQKMPATIEMVKEELEEGYYDKIVIFAIHMGVIEGMRDALSKYKAVSLYGGTPAHKRQRRIDRFQRDPKCRVFIGNIAACGTAISLTAANQVLFVEQEWSPTANAQAAMRCHRRPQEKPVFVRCVGLADSIDESVNKILKRKTRDIVEIFDAPPQVYEDRNLQKEIAK